MKKFSITLATLFICITAIGFAKQSNAETPFDWCNENGGETAKIVFGTGERYFNDQDYEWAWNFFADAAGQCSRDAIARLGLMAWNGLHVKKDPKLAGLLFKKAADLGEPKAQLLVGTWHKNGEFGLPKNLYKARQLFQDSFEEGVVEAGEQLGHAYLYGWGGEQSIEKAIATYIRTDEMGGTPFNSMQLGFLHNMGIGVKLNDAKAISYYRKALAGGETDAASGVALVFDLNDLFEEALLWNAVDIELNGFDGIDLVLLSELKKEVGQATARQMKRKAQTCISSNYKNCAWPDLNREKFKPLRSMRIAFNEFSFQDRSAIQYHLKNKGFYSGNVDAAWGTNTAKGVVEFARKENIPTRNSAYIFTKLIASGPAPKFKHKTIAKKQSRTKSDDALLKAMLGAIALSAGQSGFVSGLAGQSPKLNLYEKHGKDTGFTTLRLNGKRLNCFHYGNLGHTNCH